MPVIGINLRKIDARKNEEITGAVKVDNSTNLKDVKEQDLPVLGKKGLVIGFEFKSDYVLDKKTVAEIIINGDVLFVDEKQDEVLKEWNKNKKLPEDVNLQAINTILRRCLIKALDLSQELQLPPPIGLPFASKKSEDSRYIG
jgi:hypothetical protein